MGLKAKELAGGEQVVIEVRRGPSRLAAPSIVLAAAAGLAVACLMLARRNPSAPGWTLIDDRRTVGGALEVLAVILGAISALALLWLLASWLRWRGRSVALTSLRVASVEGVLRRRIDQVLLERVVDVQVDRSMRDRLARRGTVLLELIDGSTVAIDGLAKPDAFARVMLRQAGLIPGGPGEDAGSGGSLEGWAVITENDPTPPEGTPALTATGAAARLIRLDEIDRLESEGLLDPAEAARRRSELEGW